MYATCPSAVKSAIAGTCAHRPAGARHQTTTSHVTRGVPAARWHLSYWALAGRLRNSATCPRHRAKPEHVNRRSVVGAKNLSGFGMSSAVRCGAQGCTLASSPTHRLSSARRGSPCALIKRLKCRTLPPSANGAIVIAKQRGGRPHCSSPSTKNWHAGRHHFLRAGEASRCAIG